MSAPSQEFRHSKFLDYAFLAARSEKAVSEMIGEVQLSEEDRMVLNQASDFLRNVATGAQALTSGNYHVRNFSAAMEAIEVAMNPLEGLSGVLKDRDVAQALSETADVISAKASESPMQPLNEHELEEAKLFKAFFDLFYRFILAKIDEKSRVGVLGAHGRFEHATFA